MSAQRPGDYRKFMDLVRGVSAELSPAPRSMLLLFATYATKVLGNWETFVGVTTMARGMGYALTPDGRLTRSASVAFWRTFRKLTKDDRRLLRRVPCNCVRAFPHPFHVQFDIDVLAAHQTPVPATELHSLGNQTVADCGNRSVAPCGNSSATSNSSNNSTTELQGNSTTHSPSVNGRAVARRLKPYRQYSALMQDAAARRIAVVKAIEEREAADNGGIDDE
jgi:hypothetical protein